EEPLNDLVGAQLSRAVDGQVFDGGPAGFYLDFPVVGPAVGDLGLDFKHVAHELGDTVRRNPLGPELAVNFLNRNILGQDRLKRRSIRFEAVVSFANQGESVLVFFSHISAEVVLSRLEAISRWIQVSELF